MDGQDGGLVLTSNPVHPVILGILMRTERRGAGAAISHVRGNDHGLAKAT